MTTEATTALTPPAIGQHWPGQGGVYMGTMPAIGDLPARHLIFGAESPQRLAWGPYGTEVNGANSRTDQIRIARVLRQRGHAVAGDIGKVYQRKDIPSC